MFSRLDVLCMGKCILYNYFLVLLCVCSFSCTSYSYKGENGPFEGYIGDISVQNTIKLVYWTKSHEIAVGNTTKVPGA